MNLYLDAYNEAVDERRQRELQAWAELLSRHVGTLRRPPATGRLAAAEEGGEDERPADDVRPTVP